MKTHTTDAVHQATGTSGARALVGVTAPLVGGAYAADGPPKAERPLRISPQHRLRADRHGARARLLQAVRHPLHLSKEASWAATATTVVGENQRPTGWLGRPLASTWDWAALRSAINHALAPQSTDGHHAQQQAQDVGAKTPAQIKRSPTRPRPPLSSDLAMTSPAGTHAMWLR